MRYLHGLHDAGLEHLMLNPGKPGWLTLTFALGSDPHDASGVDLRPYGNNGIGVIARLNNGYRPAGTIPLPQHYEAFARRCANFVQASPGCARWQIGNEPNHEQEWPEGQRILPEQYAECYLECRSAIKSVQPKAEVLVAAVAPWNGDWLDYWRKVITLIGTDTDGYTIHIYTHGADPALCHSDEQQHGWYWHLRTYIDQLLPIPPINHNLPVYATECNQGDHAWADVNSGWVQEAYAEIDSYNRSEKLPKIHCLCLYRSRGDKYELYNKPNVQADFSVAVARGYPVPARKAPEPPAVTPVDTVHIPNVSGLPAAQPRVWDSRLYDRGVRVTTPTVAPGQKYWRFSEGKWVNDRSLGGDHHIYVDPRINGARQVGQEIEVKWDGGSTTIKTEAKPGEPYGANFNMSPGDFSIRILGPHPSEVVSGIHMGQDEPGGFNPGAHTTSAFVAELVTMSGTIPTNPNPVPQLTHPIADPALRRVTQPFSSQEIDYTTAGHHGHAGIDFGVPVGTPIRAADSGIAVEVGDMPAGYGLYIKIAHDWGGDTVYGHLSRQDVQQGARVERGQTIGLSGSTGNSTGPHLHFALRPVRGVRGPAYGGSDKYDGFRDPAPYLNAESGQISHNLLPLIKEAAAEAGLDWTLLISLVLAESSFNPQAESAAGAMGLCQIMPATWAEWAPKIGLALTADPFDPRNNLRVGAHYLAWLLDLLDIERAALLGYNMGPNNVLQGHTPPLETTIYVAKIIHGADLLKQVEGWR